MGARETILDAAAQVMHERGLAAATTKAIARAAGYSEATLYKHFTDKQEIFLCVLKERLPRLTPLDELVGSRTVAANLEQIVSQLLRFYVASFPISASIFSRRDLLTGHRESLAGRGVGPRSPVRAVADYLRQEQRLGRVPADTDADATAALLAGAAFQCAFLATFEGAGEVADAEAWAARLVAALGTLPAAAWAR